MALDPRAVSVATTATRIDTSSETDMARGSSVAVYNNGAATVYLGDDGVTTANGYPLAAGSHMSIDLDPSEALYGIVASGTVEVRVLEAGI